MLNIRMIGNKIAVARKKINISQARLAQRLFISSQAVGKWERGESMPDITTFNRLAEILDVDLNYFSESFQSEKAEVRPAETLIERADDFRYTKQEKKPGWNMSQGNWKDADFSGLKNLHEKFSSANMQRCKFIGSDLSGLFLKTNNLDSCDFSNSDMSGSHIQASNIDNTLVKDSSLQQVKFLKSHIKSCDFSGSNLRNSRIERSHLSHNLFKGSSLQEAEFLKSFIEGCDFSAADFTEVMFKSGGFENNTITDSIWNRASFIGMQLKDTVFNGMLEDCYFENCVFNWVKFENATLTNIFFKNNRLNGYKRIRFIDCQADRITLEFLKSGNADLTGITLLTP